MLSEADARLVRADPQIPALSLLLDPAAFAETLRELYPDAGVTAAAPVYVRYKRGTSCLVGYRVGTAAGTTPLYARGHDPAIEAKLEKAAQRTSVGSAQWSGIEVRPEAALVVYPFPNDHELPALRDLVDDETRPAVLRELFPERVPLWSARLETLRYKPERRYVARVHAPDDPGAVLKFYTREEYPALRGTMDTFTSAPPLRVPRRLLRSKRLRVAAAEWLDGRSLRGALAAGQTSSEDWCTVGAALAAMHAQRCRRLQVVHTAGAYAQSLMEAAAAIADVLPDAADRAQRLAEHIGERLVRRHWRSGRTIHGDLSADQILLDDGTAVVVDFDRASRGDPRIDLGTLRARLIYDVVCEGLDADRAAASFETMVESYRQAAGKDVTRKLDRFTAASLLRCAAEPFRHRNESWPAAIEALLEQAARLAGGRDGA